MGLINVNDLELDVDINDVIKRYTVSFIDNLNRIRSNEVADIVNSLPQIMKSINETERATAQTLGSVLVFTLANAMISTAELIVQLERLEELRQGHFEGITCAHKEGYC